MRMVKKSVSVYTERIGFDVYAKLEKIFSGYGSAKNCIYSRFSSVGSLARINNGNEIRDALTKEGFLDLFGIPKRYVRMAVDEALTNIKTNWAQAKKDTKILIRNNKNLSDEDQHFLYYALKVNDLFSDILICQRNLVFPEKFIGLNIKRLCSLLRRYIRKTLPSKSHTKVCSSMMVDAEMWSWKDKKFFLSGIKRSRRYEFKLNSKMKLEGNLRIMLDREKKRLKISNLIFTKAKALKEYGEAIGIDKNYVNAIDTSSGTSYGEELNKEQGVYTDALTAKNKKRSYYHSLVKKCREEGNHEKANKIEKHNLGNVKYKRLKNKLFEEIRKKVRGEKIGKLG